MTFVVRFVLSALFCTVVPLAFALPFWWFCGRGDACPADSLWQPAAIGTVLVLGVTVVAVKLFGSGRLDPHGDEQRRRHAAFVAEREAYVRSLEAYRHDPVHAKWIPRAAQRLVTTTADLDAWETRYQQLLADPRRAWAAPRMLEGRDMTDLEIDYEADPAMRVTCVHLQPLEGALRDAGVRVTARIPLHVTAFATIDLPRARRRFALGPSVIEHIEPEHPHQAEERDIRCTACGASIGMAVGGPFPPE